MSNKLTNILKALLFLVLSVSMFTLKQAGMIDSEADWPLVASILFGLLTIIYAKQAFTK